MKNNLLTLAGTLTPVAVLGKFYAIPAVAQATRAGLVHHQSLISAVPLRRSARSGGGSRELIARYRFAGPRITSARSVRSSTRQFI